MKEIEVNLKYKQIKKLLRNYNFEKKNSLIQYILEIRDSIKTSRKKFSL